MEITDDGHKASSKVNTEMHVEWKSCCRGRVINYHASRFSELLVGKLGGTETAVARLYQLTMADSNNMTYTDAVTLPAPEESCCIDTQRMDNNDRTWTHQQWHKHFLPQRYKNKNKIKKNAEIICECELLWNVEVRVSVPAFVVNCNTLHSVKPAFDWLWLQFHHVLWRTLWAFVCFLLVAKIFSPTETQWRMLTFQYF